MWTNVIVIAENTTDGFHRNLLGLCAFYVWKWASWSNFLFYFKLLMVTNDHHQYRLAPQFSYPTKLRMRTCSLKHNYDHHVITSLRHLIIKSLTFFMYDCMWKNHHGLLSVLMKFLHIHSPENDINLAFLFRGACGPKIQ